MNTNIKKLVESLFDDDIDDILKGMTDDNVSKQLENNMFSLNELKSLLEQLIAYVINYINIVIL